MKNISVFPFLLISTVLALGSITEFAKAAVDSDGDGVNDYREGKDRTDPSSAASFEPLSRGLVAYYPLDGNASDESGNNYNGSSSNITYATDRFGAPSTSISCKSNGYIEVTQLNSMPYYPITYSAWVKLETSLENFLELSGFATMTIVGREQAGYGNQGAFTLQTATYVDAGFQNRFTYYTGATGINSNRTPMLNEWHHIVFTLNANNSAAFYLDGALIHTESFSADQSANLPFRIGRHSGPDQIPGRPSWQGAIDDVRIYNRALSSNDVTHLYNYELGADSDSDSLGDYQETQIGTDPNNPDTDGDGLKDGAEYLLADLGFDPLVPNGELMNSLFAPSFYPSIEIFAPASTALKISLGGVDTVSTNSLPAGWVFNTSTKQMSGVLSGIASSGGQMTGGKTNGLNLPVTFNFHPQNRQTIAKFTRIAAKRINAPPFVVLPPIASSGLPVSLSVKSGPATISSNNVVTITGVGTVVIAANQPGNNNFLPAPEVTTSFKVSN